MKLLWGKEKMESRTAQRVLNFFQNVELNRPVDWDEAKRDVYTLLAFIEKNKPSVPVPPADRNKMYEQQVRVAIYLKKKILQDLKDFKAAYIGSRSIFDDDMTHSNDYLRALTFALHTGPLNLDELGNPESDEFKRVFGKDYKPDSVTLRKIREWIRPQMELLDVDSVLPLFNQLENLQNAIDALVEDIREHPHDESALEEILSGDAHIVEAINSVLKRRRGCVLCNKISTHVCGECKIASYCSAECQSRDWKEHSEKICRFFRT